MLNVIYKSFTLNVVMLNSVMLSVIMLSVVAPIFVSCQSAKTVFIRKVAEKPDIMGDLRDEIEAFYKRDHVEVEIL